MLTHGFNVGTFWRAIFPLVLGCLLKKPVAVSASTKAGAQARKGIQNHIGYQCFDNCRTGAEQRWLSFIKVELQIENRTEFDVVM